jgi:hypothetical protein
LTNHVATLVSIDFFTVPTLTGRVFFVFLLLAFLLLAHHRRRIVTSTADEAGMQQSRPPLTPAMGFVTSPAEKLTATVIGVEPILAKDWIN